MVGQFTVVYNLVIFLFENVYASSTFTAMRHTEASRASDPRYLMDFLGRALTLKSDSLSVFQMYTRALY